MVMTVGGCLCLWLIRVECHSLQKTPQGNGICPFLLLIHAVVEEFQSLGQGMEDPWGTGRARDFSALETVGTLKKEGSWLCGWH